MELHFLLESLFFQSAVTRYKLSRFLFVFDFFWWMLTALGWIFFFPFSLIKSKSCRSHFRLKCHLRLKIKLAFFLCSECGLTACGWFHDLEQHFVPGVVLLFNIFYDFTQRFPNGTISTSCFILHRLGWVKFSDWIEEHFLGHIFCFFIS